MGYSLGAHGLRVGKDAKGRSYTSVSIPGTGISNRTYTKSLRNKGQGSYTSATQLKSQTPRSQMSGRVVGEVFAYVLAAVSLYFAISFLLHLL